jgi:hypothetical protein
MTQQHPHSSYVGDVPHRLIAKLWRRV